MELAVTVVGADRPGIVAAVTGALYEAGCNLKDATSTILSGHFAMVLVVEAPPGTDPSDLDARLQEVANRLDLVVTARPVAPGAAAAPSPTHVVSVYGSDRPGIVYRVARRLAEAGANITDLSSRVIGPPDRPVYALLMEVQAPGRDLEADLRGLTEELDVELTVRPVEADVL